MGYLLRDELKKISKEKLILAWVLILTGVIFITGIIVTGVANDGKIINIIEQNNILDVGASAINDKWFGWPSVAVMFGSLFIKAAFIIFEGALISKIIIDEFKNKTIYQLFSYPVRKGSLLWSKVILVLILSFFFQVTAQLLVIGLIKVLSLFTGYSFVITANSLMKILIGSIGACLIGLIPMAVGLIKYSTMATLLTSLGVVVVICNALPGTLSGNLISSIPFMIIVGIIGIAVTEITIMKIIKKDVIAK